MASSHLAEAKGAAPIGASERQRSARTMREQKDEYTVGVPPHCSELNRPSSLASTCRLLVARPTLTPPCTSGSGRCQPSPTTIEIPQFPKPMKVDEKRFEKQVKRRDSSYSCSTGGRGRSRACAGHNSSTHAVMLVDKIW